MADIPVRIARFVAGRLREGFMVERYSEEWAADLACIEGARRRWKYALSLLCSMNALKRARAPRRAEAGGAVTRAYSHVNSKGNRYYLWFTTVTLRGGEEQTIYYFATSPSGMKGSPAQLPVDRVVKENPRNGFLTISKKKY
ncbi:MULTISPECIES: hypothetical protein [unclassified Streptomyces]|uniref:hypothetical protein n=1 Tax=unclassified Streptomyces TaxID=2593676 RepID=UPI002E2C5FF5|nr:hypothetical protein [Streptomyces sp. NBC_01423]WSX89048.1 hypothetical protein OH827_00150 [Streptomyces sp. NBC_00891]WSY03527.1 hypothetical protein OG464_00150 [Streptomyces sp. NBC_00890]WSZ05154.1 hypothetical protein OG704_00150 [Streptomyces sp. NBC_00869]WSZ27351.1 hypothetical protein OG498_33415 [Streptomyces sp. NBC_00870]